MNALENLKNSFNVQTDTKLSFLKHSENSIINFAERLDGIRISSNGDTPGISSIDDKDNESNGVKVIITQAGNRFFTFLQ